MALVEEVGSGQNAEPPKLSEELTELREEIRRSRLAAGMDPEEGEAIESQQLDRGIGEELEELTTDQMDSPLTPEEAAVLYAKDREWTGNRYETFSVREAARALAQAEDPILTQLIAEKRRQMGEPPSG